MEGGLSSAECYVMPLKDKTKSQNLITCERYRNLLLNWCIDWEGRSQRAQEGARRRKHAEYVLRSRVSLRRIFSYFKVSPQVKTSPSLL